MFREYQDARIKENLKFVKVLSLIALVLWGICTIGYLVGKWYPFELMKTEPQKISSSYMHLFWGGKDIWERILDKGRVVEYGPGMVMEFKSTYDLWSEEIMLDVFLCLIYFSFALSFYLFSKRNKRNVVSSEKQDDDEETNDYAHEPKWLTTTKNKITQQKQKWTEIFSEESKYNNDFLNSLFITIMCSIPVAVGAMLILSVIIASIAGTIGNIAGGISIVAFHLGVMFLPHFFLIVSSALFIQNCVLIKREWKTNPPQFLLEEQQQAAEEQRKAEEQAQKQKTEQDTATCKELLDQCGMQFFIEYYPQLKRLPIPDITVSDHYFPERQVRLTAAKKIVDLGLTECALHYIIETFGDIFPEETIEQAKTLLVEMEK